MVMDVLFVVAGTGRSASYSITSSARATSVSGTVRPSAFAVLRLMNKLELCRLYQWQVRKVVGTQSLGHSVAKRSGLRKGKVAVAKVAR